MRTLPTHSGQRERTAECPLSESGVIQPAGRHGRREAYLDGLQVMSACEATADAPDQSTTVRSGSCADVLIPFRDSLLAASNAILRGGRAVQGNHSPPKTEDPERLAVGAGGADRAVFEAPSAAHPLAGGATEVIVDHPLSNCGRLARRGSSIEGNAVAGSARQARVAMMGRRCMAFSRRR